MFSIAFDSLTSPLLLIALSVAGGGCLFVSYKNQGKKIRVLGENFIKDTDHYSVIWYVSITDVFNIYWLTTPCCLTRLWFAEMRSSAEITY